jgi:hypothetical protein
MAKFPRVLWIVLALGASSYVAAAAPAQGAGQQIPNGELLRRLIEIVVQKNPILASQAMVIERNRSVGEPRSTSAITGVNLGAGIANNSSSPTGYLYAPTANLGVSFAISDPVRALDIMRITQEKEQAKQQWLKTKNELIAQLCEKINRILQLKSQQANLGGLKGYLVDYAALVEKQVRQGIVEPDRSLALKEKLATLEVQLDDANNQLGTVRLETAMSLGGEAWQEMLQLLEQLQMFP